MGLLSHIKLIPVPILLKGLIFGTISLTTTLLIFQKSSWVTLGLLTGSGFLISPVILGNIARKYPLIFPWIQKYLPSIFSNIGIRVGNRVYLISKTYRIILPEEIKLPISPIRWHDHDDHYRVWCLFSRVNHSIKKIILPAGYSVTYEIDGQEYDIPINLEVPGDVDEGVFVLYQRVRKGFSFGRKECDRSAFWPTPYLQQLLDE